MSIRAHLLLLALFSALPVLGFAALVSVVLIDHERTTFEHSAVERARAMMSAVDAEMRGHLATLDAVASSTFLRADNLRAFEAEAQSWLARQDAFTSLSVARPTGEKLLDTRVAAGAPAGRILEPRSFERAVATGEPQVGDIARPEAGAPPGIYVRVPFSVDGKLRYVVTGTLRPEAFSALIHEQRIPEGWVSGLVDGNGNYVARVPARAAGTPASTAFRTAVRQGSEGWYRGPTVEGIDTYTAFRRSELNQWTIGLAIPADVVSAGSRRATALLLAGAIAALALAGVLALLIARRIGRPVSSLSDAARRLGASDDPVTLDPGAPLEIGAVAHALNEANLAVRERERLVLREKEALQQVDRAKDQFIATLSHELRNPLAALTSASAILQHHTFDSAPLVAARDVIERQVRNMAKMIEDLLDVSRIVAGKIRLERSTFDLADVAKACVANWRLRMANARDVVVHTHPTPVTGDRTRLEQVVANLLDNATKFTATGGSIRIEVRPEGSLGVVEVADDGIGIASDMLPTVFDPFVQGAPAAAPVRGSGLGLGLSLVRRLVELHGGTVDAQSAGPGRGSRFTVRLPLAAPSLALPALQPDSTGELRGKRILVVDDIADVRDVLVELLRIEGHTVAEAATAREALEALHAVDPEVCLLDIGLPDMSGYELARRVREELGPGTRLIALTGFGQSEDRERAREAGFDEQLVKPVTMAALRSAIERETSKAA